MQFNKVLIVFFSILCLTGIGFASATPASRQAEITAQMRHLHVDLGKTLSKHKTSTPETIRGFENRLQQIQSRINHAGLASVPEFAREQRSLTGWLQQLKQQTRSINFDRKNLRSSSEQKKRPRLSSLDTPSNDFCANAIPVVEGSYTGDTCSATNDGMESCTESSSPDVWFAFTATSTGTITVNTEGSDYDTALSVHSACPGDETTEIACNDDCKGLTSCVTFDAVAGNTYQIRVGGFDEFSAGSFKLNILDPSAAYGSISGTVTSDATADPLFDAGIDLFSASGDYVDSAYTDEAGHYSFANLPPGNYFAVTYTYDNFMDELFDNIPCPGENCDALGGTPIVVNAGSETPDINFALSAGATISGKVRAADTGAPIDSDIYVVDSDGNDVAYGYTDENGDYTVTALTEGTYFVYTDNYQRYMDELYDNFRCERGCDPATGTPVIVHTSENVAGIDFALNPGGEMAGAVSDSKTGKPLYDVEVDVFDQNGLFVSYGYTDKKGAYVAGGLEDGNYFAATYADDGVHIDELYNNMACFDEECDLLQGDPIAVSEGSRTEGIRFSLDKGGEVYGKITNAKTGFGIRLADVHIVNADGEFLGHARTNFTGKFKIGGLPAGTLYAIASADQFVDELYGNVACPWSECNVQTGKSFTVTAGKKTRKINIQMDQSGSISGTVRSVLGEPILDADVEIVTSDGNTSVWTSVDANGNYKATGLVTGAYFARVFNYDQYVDELYNDIPCSNGCDILSGTPISVTNGAETPGIDFTLEPGGSISGTITSAETGNPLSDLSVRIFDSNGSYVDSAWVYSCGRWQTSGLAAGVYFVETTNDSGYVDELYNNIPCAEQSCNPTEGTAVIVTSGQETQGIDFDLNLEQ